MAIKFFLTFVLALNLCEVTLSSDIEIAFTHHQVIPHAVNVAPQEEMEVKPLNEILLGQERYSLWESEPVQKCVSKHRPEFRC